LGNHQLRAVYDLLRVSEYVMAVGINNRGMGGYDMVDFNGF
jgi:hypothetical protein